MKIERFDKSGEVFDSRAFSKFSIIQKYSKQNSPSKYESSYIVNVRWLINKEKKECKEREINQISAFESNFSFLPPPPSAPLNFSDLLTLRFAISKVHNRAIYNTNVFPERKLEIWILASIDSDEIYRNKFYFPL